MHLAVRGEIAGQGLHGRFAGAVSREEIRRFRPFLMKADAPGNLARELE